MKIKIFSLVFFSALIFVWNGCSGTTDTNNNNQSDLQNNNEKIDQKKSQPTREQMISDLNILYRKISNSKVEEAKKFLKIPSSVSNEEIETEFSRSIENNEISAEGIAILSEKGSFGKLRDIFPEETDSWIKRSEIKNDGNCFAIKFNQAEVAGYWNGENFVFFRFDNVGKLGINSFSQNTYTPEKGSKERQAIMDIFREDFGSEKDEILFRVEHIKINQNWACAYVSPLKYNVDYGEPRWGLFNFSNGRWRQVDWSDGIEIENDFELIDLPTQNGRIAKLIVKKYPSCSMSIFGN